MARKIYFDPRTKDIGKFLRLKDFEEYPYEDIRTTFIRSSLEIIQEDGKLYLINNAKKEYVLIEKMFHAAALKDFVRTGILPFKELVKPLPIEA